MVTRSGSSSGVNVGGQGLRRGQGLGVKVGVKVGGRGRGVKVRVQGWSHDWWSQSRGKGRGSMSGV